MAARPLQPSEYEIQREVEALRDIKRRSTAPGALVIDPDLPNQSSPSSPTSYWAPKSPTLKPAAFLYGNADNDSLGSSSEGSSSSDHSRSSGGSRPTEAPNNPADDPFHLFWVPASLHPEIAPAEFRAFLKEHARSPSDALETSEGSPSPSSLSSSSSLNRRKSMLSRQYRPKHNDGVEEEEENVVPLKRNRSLLYPINPGPQLTISDLQKLEELAEEASASDDPSKLRNVLRRSLSMNLSPSAIDLMDNIPEMGDEADAPIIVPPPGQILRRTARTKIRKPGLPGDGGGHRFGTSRRASTKLVPASEPRSSSDMSASDHGELDLTPVLKRRHTVSDDGSHNISRPDSFSEEASIYDAYARDDEDDLRFAASLITLPSPIAEEPLPLPVTDVPRISPEVIPQQDPVAPIIQQPQPQRVLVLPPTQVQGPFPARGPSPSAPVPGHPIAHSPPIPISTSPPLQARKEKDKKGLFGKWGGDKGGKKGNKVKDRENRVTAAEKEKESGFFGSLFGKKKQDSEYSSSMAGGTSGREAAQALLGASKSSKTLAPSPSPGLAPGIGGNPYARYPIHVERAIYRLSHIKLANPRRPLYEQVLISNLMFWYLGVINKAQNPTPPTQSAQTNESHEDKDAAEREREQREREQREKAENERLENERLEKEQREKELELKKKESGRRGSLTKTNAGIPSGGGRHAEMPVKGPQYEMQHRVMEQEYGPYNGQPRGSISLVNGPPAQQYSRSVTPPQFGSTGQQPPMVQQDPFYYQPRPENNPPRTNLPPGAMAPAEQLSWMSQPSSPPQYRRPSPNPPNPAGQRRSNSPPSHNQHGQQQLMQLPKLNTSQESLGDKNGPRNAGRSLSATAFSTPALPLTNGHVRKGRSAHAIIPHEQRPRSEEQPPTSPTSGEEEDLPLAAVWQRRRK
ncbi:hypothetical protein BYT27DRAFT_7074637 [Phlegmacium glaucopus]|nr:hypothetical protein BYT27DRAFT_7074637 [Phlegmacium glaucopus]